VICRLITPRLSLLFVGEPRRLAAASWAVDSAPLSPTNPRPSGRFYDASIASWSSSSRKRGNGVKAE
jgi:hypothetical protein